MEGGLRNGDFLNLPSAPLCSDGGLGVNNAIFNGVLFQQMQTEGINIILGELHFGNLGIFLTRI